MARLSVLVLAAVALIAALLSTAADAQGMAGVAVAPSAQEILPGAETQPKAGAGVGVGGGYRRSLLKKKKANATNATTTGTGRHLLKKKKANTTNTTPASTMGGH